MDDMLCGGVQPGSLTVVRGATGVGKTQLGLAFLDAGSRQEGQRGIVMDLASRGDSQQHQEYAHRLFDWDLRGGEVPLGELWNGSLSRVDYYSSFQYSGRRVVRENLSEEEWRSWKRILNEKLEAVIGHFYYHFVQGVRRVVVDGVEPFDSAGDSIQVELFEYILHRILRKRCDLVARDLFRGKWLEVRDQVAAHPYDYREIAGVFLQTTKEVDIEDLIRAETQEDDLTTNATTIVLLGRVLDGSKVRRAAFVLKNRGQKCSDELVFFEVAERGLVAAK
jgi:hypothetical protein